MPAATGIGVPRGIGNLSTRRLNTRQMASSVVIPLDGTSDVVSTTNKSWIEALRDALVCGRPLPDAPDGTPATLRAAAQKLVEARQQTQSVQRMLSNSQSKQGRNGRNAGDSASVSSLSTVSSSAAGKRRRVD
jgi:hypothetical protein